MYQPVSQLDSDGGTTEYNDHYNQQSQRDKNMSSHTIRMDPDGGTTEFDNYEEPKSSDNGISLSDNGIPLNHVFLPHGQLQNTQFLIGYPGNSPNNMNISFGHLGSFLHGTPKLQQSPPQMFPEPKTSRSKDTRKVYKLGKDQCKEALKTWVKSLFWKSSKIAEEGHIGEVFTYNAFDYVLDTFNVTRSIECVYSSVTHSQIRESLNCPGLPDIWSGAFSSQPDADKMFVDHKKFMPIPGTDIIQDCFTCNGNGKLRCDICFGSGGMKCSKCNGTGQCTITDPNGSSQLQKCDKCDGCALIGCYECTETGAKVCLVCNGVKSVKWYLQIVVDYINHKEEYIKDKSALPDELLKYVKGETISNDEGLSILPILDSDSDDIVENTKRLIDKANQNYPQEYRIKQRHHLKLVTVAECPISFNGKEYKFWIYGEERKIHFPDFPGGMSKYGIAIIGITIFSVILIALLITFLVLYLK